MNTSKNSYTVIYVAVMVALVAVILSVTALSLKPKQDENVRVEKMGDILRSIGKGGAGANIEAEYNKYIVNAYTVDDQGNIEEGTDAFAIALDLESEYEKPATERNLPVFEARLDDGTTYYIIPVSGSGLWGPVWGNVALEADFDTIYGVTFGHKGETPGLGAEITTPAFTGQFKEKTIYAGTNLVAITVLKGAGSSAGNPNAVDAITGGTITSRGVEAMLKENLAGYAAYFNKMRMSNLVP